MIVDILQMLSECRVGKDTIDVPKTLHEELHILTEGGVRVSDFEKAIDIWLNMRTPVTNSYGFIRNMALKSAAERLQILLENEDG
jgi:hypothetical protein